MEISLHLSIVLRLASMLASVLPVLPVVVASIELPGACQSNQFFDSGWMRCAHCWANASKIVSADGCQRCNATQVVSADGSVCVPRPCHRQASRVVCRKCPPDHITVTQNPNGSPVKEVTCMRCARGYQARGSACVQCPACACDKLHTVVRGVCVPKKFLQERPKYEGTTFTSTAVLDIVKNEYLCTQEDTLACRVLAGDCVRSLYCPDIAGPCRLWLQSPTHKHYLPPLTLDASTDDGRGRDAAAAVAGEVLITDKKEGLWLVVAAHGADGAVRMLTDPADKPAPCLLPAKLTMGYDVSQQCEWNITSWGLTGSTLAPYALLAGELTPVPVTLRGPDGRDAHSEAWSSDKFRRFFLADAAAAAANSTNSGLYLSSLLVIVRVRVVRDGGEWGLRVRVRVECELARGARGLRHTATTTARVLYELPPSTLARGLEIWAGVMGSFLSLLALVQWRGAARRGGAQLAVVPALAGAIADALYFAGWMSLAGAWSMNWVGSGGLPLSASEDRVVRDLVLSATLLKACKVAWVNWKQCRCDVFLLDWSEYNPPAEEDDSSARAGTTDGAWRRAVVAREWRAVQTVRRTPPVATAIAALVAAQLLTSWQDGVAAFSSYVWWVGTLGWALGWSLTSLGCWAWWRVRGCPSAGLGRVCRGTSVSLLVFQEELYAHYVHARHEGSVESSSQSGPLTSCRVAVAPQLRAIYSQLSSPAQGVEGRRLLLTRFLAAFFERALDGLGWVGVERTLTERLLDVELRDHAAADVTSALLYDPHHHTPSCFAVTWWGEEWTLGSFEAMVFGAALMTGRDRYAAALITITTWKVMKEIRQWCGERNIDNQIDTDNMAAQYYSYK